MAVVATLASQESSTPNSLSSADPDPRAVAALWTLWERMAAMFPGKWARANGAAPVAQSGALTTAGEVWLQVITGLSPKKLAAGLSACMRDALDWPPNPPRFRALCFDVPALALVQQEIRPGRAQCGFTVLVRSLLDLHVYASEDGYNQARMLQDAYERAVRHVVDGKPVPEPALALPPAAVGVAEVRDRQAAREAMERAAAELGFEGVP
ncbi:hypothetical protein [Stenotrophomonas rhizophila]|uniref:hypothetical protein n=1 Tax=Stenotrophomonas rhizophila TaxID=216778 RepID=UPI001FDAA6CF|nr:hypothetical protein [Stenotrophomonas rhizophila]